MVVGIGRLYPTQTGETSFHETMCRRGRSTSAVTGLSNMKTNNDGMTFLLTVFMKVLKNNLFSAEEQVRGVVGDGAEKHVRRKLAKDVADRSRTRISDSIRSGSVEEVRHPLLTLTTRRREGEHRRKIQ